MLGLWPCSPSTLSGFMGQWRRLTWSFKTRDATKGGCAHLRRARHRPSKWVSCLALRPSRASHLPALLALKLFVAFSACELLRAVDETLVNDVMGFGLGGGVNCQLATWFEPPAKRSNPPLEKLRAFQMQPLSVRTAVRVGRFPGCGDGAHSLISESEPADARRPNDE